jgi:hypothetical protein
MSGTTETVARKFDFAPPSERKIELWRALLGLDRTVRASWTLNEEVRSKATRDRSPRPLVGANADVWKRVLTVRGDSAAIVDARREAVAAEHGAAVDDFIGWLDSENFGDDPDRMRRDAWR